MTLKARVFQKIQFQGGCWTPKNSRFLITDDLRLLITNCDYWLLTVITWSYEEPKKDYGHFYNLFYNRGLQFSPTPMFVKHLIFDNCCHKSYPRLAHPCPRPRYTQLCSIRKRSAAKMWFDQKIHSSRSLFWICYISKSVSCQNEWL